jgi:AcrR family transcriptional regulator
MTRKTAGRKRKPAPLPRPYHHGDLPQALLTAAEAVLVRDGIAGLGLRAIAREAGVSHTAPKHHFRETTAMLSELAAVGYRRLGAAMLSALAGAKDTRARRKAIGHAYVHFALDNPALFGLMFRSELIDVKHPVLQEAARDAMRTMATTVGDETPITAAAVQLSEPDALRITAAWAYVHGLATLLIEQRLRGIVKLTPAFDNPVELADAVLERVRMSLETTRSTRGR